MNLFLIICSFVLSVEGGKLLAVQKFGGGYPSFHVIHHNDDGKQKKVTKMVDNLN